MRRPGTPSNAWFLRHTRVSGSKTDSRASGSTVCTIGLHRVPSVDHATRDIGSNRPHLALRAGEAALRSSVNKI